MKPETSPELRQIQEEFDISWAVGGIEAVKPIITRLAIEKAMLEVYRDSFVDFEYKTGDMFRIGEIQNLVNSMDRADFADEVAEDYEHAIGQHALAVSMLEAKLENHD